MGKVSDKVNAKRRAAVRPIPVPSPQVVAPAIKRDRCGQCANWDIKDRAPDMGLCRANPPQLIMENGTMRAYWPVLHKDEWCGAFKPAVDSNGS